MLSSVFTNSSSVQGWRVPLSWKVSRITPVYKCRGSVTDPRFYCPIAVLPMLSMVFERVVYSQLYRHISTYIPSTQFGFVKGTGAQDCGAALVFAAIQALERRQECQIVSLDIRGAFDSVWWGGLLQHLWSVGLRGKAYCLLYSYLCDRDLFVVAHGNTSSRRSFTAGLPQDGIWSPMLFNLYIRHLPTQILHCAFLQYADDSTLIKVVPLKDDRIAAADEMNADLVRICSWGRMWNINFEPAKCHSLCVSLKRDTDSHPPLFMATLLIEEVDVLKILGVYFDRKLTWGHMIDQLTVCCRQRLGALFRVREYLGQGGLAVAYKSFVRPVCEYGCVILWVLQLCTYINWMGCRRQLRDCVKYHFNPCHLVARPVPSVCCASCWTFVVNSHSRIFPPPLSLSHILVVCDISVMILCCCGALSSITHWIYL